MADLAYRQNSTPTAKLYVESSTMYKTREVPAIHGVPVLTLFEKIVRKNRKKTAPHTIRRPSYLQYIDY